MISATRVSRGSPQAATARQILSSSSSSYGRTVAYRRLLSQASINGEPARVSASVTSPSARSLSSFSATRLRSPWEIATTSNSFHSSAVRLQSETKKSEEPSAKQSEQQSEKEDGKEESKEEKGEGKEEKKDAPPPPPHGDKSPWQVFTETLRSEFKASKEWNESTKALASSAHQFTENENVKKARAAYEAASSATTSRTATAFKKTGTAIGSGAAWTWDTSVVKGLRSGVNATGRGIEKVTRPVRETEAYKTAVGGVKEAIDDGSSSRYGGWIEKEERRKQRELREMKEAMSGKSQKVEKMEEDPEYVLFGNCNVQVD